MASPAEPEPAPESPARSPGTSPSDPSGPANAARGWLLALLALTLAYALSVRARLAVLEHPLLATAPATGVLKSDPALLGYITQRIIDAGGGVPADFRADPRVQHPVGTDLAAEFTVGQEFLVAWAWRWLAPDGPLHVFAQRVMALVASLVVPAAFLLVLWATGRKRWALLAAALALALPANYRTDGFVLVREDLSIPLFAFHLALLARAAMRGERWAFGVAGLFAGAAMATWHAMGFVLTFELALAQLWFLRRGASPLEGRGAWLVALGPVLACAFVPALRTSGALLGPAMALLGSLLVLALVRRRRTGLGPAASVSVAAGGFALLAALGQALAPARGAHAHVRDVLLAKLSHLGARPADPSGVPFDARLLWQGPFEALAPSELMAWLGWGGVLLLLGAVVVGARRWRELAGFEAWVLAATLAAIPLALLIGRTLVLLGVLLPASIVVLRRERAEPLALAGVALVTLLAGARFLGSMGQQPLPWYRPAERQHELAALVDWLCADPEDALADGEPIATDFMNGPAILLHTGHAIVLQPKYETEASRRRAQAFLETFFHGTTDELARLVREEWNCELLLVDRYTLGELSPWVAGQVGAPTTGSAAATLLATDDEVLASVPGYELLYRSPASLRDAAGEAADFYRLFRLR